MQKLIYIAPKVDILAVRVESGFSVSGSPGDYTHSGSEEADE